MPIVSTPLIVPKNRAKPGYSVGIEFDHLSIRGARLKLESSGNVLVESLLDRTGDLSDDSNLISAIRKMKEDLKIGNRDNVSTCLTGKNVFASQISFRKIPQDEMEQALRLEMRKVAPFEVSGSALDYQILNPDDSQSKNIPVIVALAGNEALTRQLSLFERAGMSPSIIDVLPIAAANAMWNWVDGKNDTSTHLGLHVGPQISTIVLDGRDSHFFNRYIYLAAEELIGLEPNSPVLERNIQILVSEIARSIAFYEKSANGSGIQEILIFGEYLDTPTLLEQVQKRTGLMVRRMDLPKKFGFNHGFPLGRFDLAVTLALQAWED